MKLHKLHLSNGSTVDVWADSQGEAVKKFRKWCPDVVFMTEEGMARAVAAKRAKEEALAQQAQDAAEPVLEAAE